MVNEKANVVKFPIRVVWQKTGNAKYISHLDTQRAITRALTRSSLPLYYSQGFNPHIKLVFALPISIYQECLYDVFDIALEHDMPMSQVLPALQKAMPDCMQAISVARPVKKLKDLANASYIIELTTDMTAEEVKAALSGAVTVEKKTKKKTELTDISPMIRSISTVQAPTGVELTATLSAAPNAYLNPKYLVDFLGDRIKADKITRTALLDDEGKLLK